MKISKWVAIMAIMALTSCRKVPSASQNSAGKQEVTVAHVEPERAQIKPERAQIKPERAQSKDERSCKEFVQKFYDWYVSSEVIDDCKKQKETQEKTHIYFDDSLNSCKRASEFHSVKVMSLKQALSPKLKRLLDVDAAAQAKETDGIVGLDGDPFLNGNAGVIYNYIVDSAQVTDGKCHATVNESGINGNQEEEGKIYDRLVLDLSKSSEQWMIDNIHYRFNYFDQAKNAEVSRDEDLIQELNALGDK
jgi:hypothetical protein